MPFDQQEFESEVLRAADGPPGGLVPAHNRMGDSVLRNLVAARELLGDRRRWTRGDYCVGDSFCALGAILAVAGEDTSSRTASCGNVKYEIMALKSALSPNWRGGVHFFNDAEETTHADVLALFDRAIAARKSELGPV